MNKKLQSFISAVGVWVWLFAPYASAEYLELNDGVILGETIITDQGSLSDESLAVWQKYSDALFSDNNLERAVALEALSAKAESGDPDLQQLLGNYFAEFLNGRRGLVNIEDAEASAFANPNEPKRRFFSSERSPGAVLELPATNFVPERVPFALPYANPSSSGCIMSASVDPIA